MTRTPTHRSRGRTGPFLGLKGAIATLDALGCQKGIATAIRQREGHDVLALEENHPGLPATSARRWQTTSNG